MDGLHENAKVRILTMSHFGETGTVWRVWLDGTTVDVKFEGGLLTLKRNQIEVL